MTLKNVPGLTMQELERWLALALGRAIFAVRVRPETNPGSMLLSFCQFS
jgi:hypothetical protein